MQVATRIMKHLIDEFSVADLFGRHNYEWYARVTGRVLRVQGQLICSFTMPPELPHDFLYTSKYLLFDLNFNKLILELILFLSFFRIFGT